MLVLVRHCPHGLLVLRGVARSVVRRLVQCGTAQLFVIFCAQKFITFQPDCYACFRGDRGSVLAVIPWCLIQISCIVKIGIFLLSAHAHLHTQIHACTHTHMHSLMHIHMHTPTLSLSLTHKHTGTRACTHAHTHTFVVTIPLTWFNITFILMLAPFHSVLDQINFYYPFLKTFHYSARLAHSAHMMYSAVIQWCMYSIEQCFVDLLHVFVQNARLKCMFDMYCSLLSVVNHVLLVTPLPQERKESRKLWSLQSSSCSFFFSLIVVVLFCFWLFWLGWY